MARCLINKNKKAMEKKIKFKGLWTPQYLAERLLFPKPKSIQYAEVQLNAWAYDIIDENKIDVDSFNDSINEEARIIGKTENEIKAFELGAKFIIDKLKSA